MRSIRSSMNTAGFQSGKGALGTAAPVCSSWRWGWFPCFAQRGGAEPEPRSLGGLFTSPGFLVFSQPFPPRTVHASQIKLGAGVGVARKCPPAAWLCWGTGSRARQIRG